jgi:hypothetical protein
MSRRFTKRRFRRCEKFPRLISGGAGVINNWRLRQTL